MVTKTRKKPLTYKDVKNWRKKLVVDLYGGIIHQPKGYPQGLVVVIENRPILEVDEVGDDFAATVFLRTPGRIPIVQDEESGTFHYNLYEEDYYEPLE